MSYPFATHVNSLTKPIWIDAWRNVRCAVPATVGASLLHRVRAIVEIKINRLIAPTPLRQNICRPTMIAEEPQRSAIYEQKFAHN